MPGSPFNQLTVFRDATAMGGSTLQLFCRFLATVAILSSAWTSNAQQLVQAQRPDGAHTPLRVYARGGSGCAPLAVISPGAGGSEDGYKYLAEALRGDGWRAIVMGHKESGAAVLGRDVRQSGIKGGLLDLTTNPAAYNARLTDIAAALQWASGTCQAPFTVLLGHSMGAATVMIEAGAQDKLGVTGLDRFAAYVALSPEGPGSIFPENAWSGIRKPLLILTGTRDRALEGGWQSRTVPFDSLPAGCKWLGVIDGATHMNFAGIGFAGKTEKLTLLEVKAFLDGVRDGKCGAPPPAEGITVKQK
jgi:predicted dienelactone hydrolase